MRVSLLLFSKYIVANIDKNCQDMYKPSRITHDTIHSLNIKHSSKPNKYTNSRKILQNYAIFLGRLSVLSLGIQSYMFLNYKEYINPTTKSKYNFKHLSNYLKKLVIKNIKKNINLPFKTFKYHKCLQLYGYLYLFQSYFLIGNRVKLSKVYPKIKTLNKTEKMNAIASIAPMIPYINKSRKMMPVRQRIQLVLSYIATIQKQHFETPNTVDYCDPSILRTINLILNKDTRNESYYCKWKNILNDKVSIKCYYCQKYINNDMKIKQCSKCRKAYYCSKKCQKKDWKFNNHSQKCKQMPR